MSQTLIQTKISSVKGKFTSSRTNDPIIGKNKSIGNEWRRRRKIILIKNNEQNIDHLDDESGNSMNVLKYQDFL